MRPIVFVDLEVNRQEKIKDIGALKTDETFYHGNNINEFTNFVKNDYFIAGHNIISYDFKYIKDFLLQSKFTLIDTLCLSPLIYPKRIHHNLLKDDKIISEELNNPLSDCKKTRNLFYCELEAFGKLPKSLKSIFGTLLYKEISFKGFFEYVKWSKSFNLKKDIMSEFKKRICVNCDLQNLIYTYPVELAYALALISTGDETEVVASWVQRNFPKIDKVFKVLRGTSCSSGCSYCQKKFNIRKRLKDIFSYEKFRTYNGEPLQEQAVQAAVDGKSLLAIFPTGGGKSLTFQLPALIAGETSKGLTVVISPLQSLMKDQVDGLERKNITNAVTINGMLNPVERQNSIERVFNGDASILYISPELLRSKTIERMLESRNIIRFVIDEAHCFSAWGQDFRVDYLYIGEFIKNLQKTKGLDYNIPISCFTATAKQKVITDIRDYFKEKLGISLNIYSTNAQRENLHYKVELKENEEDKYTALRTLIKEKNCSTIVYVSTTSKTLNLSEKLRTDGFKALAFNGKMEKEQKVENQEAFIRNEAQIIVATSAFGMGVDKSDVKLVVHYEISDSLENYVQEAGRAGRNENIQAECVVFFNENDLDRHFMLLKQSKLSMGDIRQIWKAVKVLSSRNNSFTCSALELARYAGWSEDRENIETSVRTAISALEEAGYLKRGLNSPKVFATSIHVKNTSEARKIIEKSGLFSEKEVIDAIRIIGSLISSKYTYKTKNSEAESRVDYLADRLAIDKKTIVSLIDRMRECKILADSKDMAAFLKTTEHHKSELEIERFAALERFLLKLLKDGKQIIDLKQLNDLAVRENINKPTINNIKKILFYWTISNYIRKTLNVSEKNYEIDPLSKIENLSVKTEKRLEVSRFIFDYLFEKASKEQREIVEFSMIELLDAYNNKSDLFSNKCLYEDIQDALLYLSKMGIMTIEGGFLVLYNAMHIERIILDNKIQYKNEDYKILKEHYQLKTEQIHIVGEYANMMVKDYDQALEFVNDYFQLEYDGFIKKYFKGNKEGQIKRTITPAKYNKIFGNLSTEQKKIIDDDRSQYISVFAGPGSGKTRVLVHKLASLLLLEGVKSEQLLMLTFSRAAASEFKTRLINLIGTAAHYVDIKTFHSYCFDLLGKIGNEEEFDDVIQSATDMINNGETEISKITKSVLVIDEAQDMDEKEYNLIQSLITKNPDMKIIAVGDDDQCVYEFRNAKPEFMKLLSEGKENSRQYELIDNYRSVKKIVDVSNSFVSKITTRMKTQPIRSIKKDNDGIVQIILHQSENMESAIVNHIEINHSKNKSIAVLTQTNEEASKVLSLLHKKQIYANLIQSNNGFNLLNLIEIYDFISHVEKNSSSPIIDEKNWKDSKEYVSKKYEDSSNLLLVEKIFEQYEFLYPNKYKSDFIEFVRESRIEDFIEQNSSSVIVSTIHKAKGHEFDTVYLLLKNLYLKDDEKKRRIYVGLTRAKTELYIHCNLNNFSYMKDIVDFKMDNNLYDDPDELIIPLTHRDVYLGSFKSDKKKEEISNARCGDELRYQNDYVYLSHGKSRTLFKFSTNFNNYIQDLSSKSYKIEKIIVKYILTWVDKEDIGSNKKYFIILPEIHLRKSSNVENKSIIKTNTNVIEKNLDLNLFEELKKTRVNLANEKKVSIYTIFSDSILEEMALQMPITKSDMLKIKGIEMWKYSLFGESFLKVIQKYKLQNLMKVKVSENI